MKTLTAMTIGLITILIIAGCASSEATRTGKYYPPTDESKIEILFEKPEKPYEVVGYIKGRGGKINSQEDVFNTMKEEAAKLGADAIYVRSEMQESNDWNPQFGMMAQKKEGTALAIKWK